MMPSTTGRGRDGGPGKQKDIVRKFDPTIKMDKQGEQLLKDGKLREGKQLEEDGGLGEVR